MSSGTHVARSNEDDVGDKRNEEEIKAESRRYSRRWRRAALHECVPTKRNNRYACGQLQIDKTF